MDSTVFSTKKQAVLSQQLLTKIHGSGELKNGQSLTLLMDGVSIRPEVQECGDRGLKLNVTKRANLVLNQFVGGEAQMGEKV